MNEKGEHDELAPWLVIVITLLGGWLRVFLLDNRGLWLDETVSLWLVNHGVGDMLHWVATIDQHPPLYYLLLHYWVALNGDTAYYARLLSALFGAGTIPIIYLIGKRLSGAAVGLVAAVFLALSPFNVYYAQETRMYTLLMFNVAVAMYALIRLLTDARSARPIGSQFRAYRQAWRAAGPVEVDAEAGFRYQAETRSQTGWRAWILRRRLIGQTIETDLAWVALIIFSAAALLTHHTALMFLLAANVFVLGLMLYQRIQKSGAMPAFQSPSFGNWVKAQFAIVLLWSPWGLTFIQQAGRVDQEFWLPKPTWDTVTQTLGDLLNASLAGQASQVMMWLLGGVLCLGVVYYRKKLSVVLFLAALVAIPFGGELLVSIRRPIFLDKTLIWTTLPVFLVLAAGIVQLRFHLLMVAVLGMLGANYLFSNGDIYRYAQKEDWSTAAGYVAKFAQKDDLVLFNSNWVEIPFDYYFKPLEKQYSIQIVRQGVPLDLFDSGRPQPKMTESDIPWLISVTSAHNRVWLVYSHNEYTDPMGLIPRTLAAEMHLSQTRDFYGGQVQLYESP